MRGIFQILGIRPRPEPENPVCTAMREFSESLQIGSFTEILDIREKLKEMETCYERDEALSEVCGWIQIQLHANQNTALCMEETARMLAGRGGAGRRLARYFAI